MLEDLKKNKATMSLLKPTRPKIMFYILLFIIFPLPVAFPNIGSCPTDMENPPMTCYDGEIWKITPLGGIFFIGALIAGGNQWFHLSSSIWEILKIPYIIFVPYLVSCLIVLLGANYRKDSK